MTRDEATDLVSGALNLLVERDSSLLDLKVCERALQFRIAHYMAKSPLIAAPLTLDCEYNRHLANEKRLALFGRPGSSRVFPDIVVHERNSDENNIIALEIKRPGQNISRDREKLRAFSAQLGYRHAGHILIGHNRRGALVQEVLWVDV